jgi:hypothetical protein
MLAEARAVVDVGIAFRHLFSIFIRVSEESDDLPLLW